uniref:Uncharacterized protein n=1 Tax=Caulobacter phage BL57 TaxID=3348355 RepID=A0AB74UNJ0_9VIRU
MPKTRPLRANEREMFEELFETLNDARPVEGMLRQRLRAFFQDYPMSHIRIADGELLR